MKHIFILNVSETFSQLILFSKVYDKGSILLNTPMQGNKNTVFGDTAPGHAMLLYNGENLKMRRNNTSLRTSTDLGIKTFKL